MVAARSCRAADTNFNDPLTTAKLYIEAGNVQRLALGELADTSQTLDATTHELGKTK